MDVLNAAVVAVDLVSEKSKNDSDAVSTTSDPALENDSTAPI